MVQYLLLEQNRTNLPILRLISDGFSFYGMAKSLLISPLAPPLCTACGRSASKLTDDDRFIGMPFGESQHKDHMIPWNLNKNYSKLRSI